MKKYILNYLKEMLNIFVKIYTIIFGLCVKQSICRLTLSNGTKIYITLKKHMSVENMKYILTCIAISLADYVVVNKINNISESMQELDIALDFGKEIYAIPGDIFEYKNYLSNFAIKQGAIPICSVYDVNNIT